MTKKRIIGYKTFNSDWTCRGIQYKIGKTYTMKEKPKVCRTGFHYCLNIADCFKYYANDPELTKIAQIEVLGDISVSDKDSKCATNKIKIVKEISFAEAYELGNHGKANTGFDNTGNRNTGDSNTGDSNTGDSNTGNWNTGYWNTGYWNIGDRNTGDWNTGYRNIGDRNTGDSNTGNWNTGYCNTGNSNTGNRNTGYRNTGNWNTGDRNTGYRNIGCGNTSLYNIGHYNTGSYNIGDSNTGHYNACNYSTGMFNTVEQPMYLFNKPTDFTMEEFENDFPDIINLLFQSTFPLTEWINYCDMTEDEKRANPSCETSGGYLKQRTYKEAWRLMWNSWTKEEQKSITELPNFDKEIFKKITGIED